MTKRVAIYLRISTVDKHQTVDTQRIELEAAAALRGWTIVATYADQGISGSKGRDKRPGLDGMLKDATRRKFDVIMAWAVDRLGRSLADLVTGLQEMHGAGVDLYLHQQAIDTTTPGGKAMFGMLGVFAEFERSMIQARVQAGIDRARATGTRSGRAIGRPALKAAKKIAVQEALAADMPVLAVVREYKISETSVQRIRAAMRAQATE